MGQIDTHSPLIERCKRETVLLAAPMIERAIAGTIAALDEALRDADVGRRSELGDAKAALIRQTGALRAGFPKVLVKAVEQALSGSFEQASKRPRKKGDSVLGLVDDAELSRFVEATRLEQMAQTVVEQALARFDSLMSSALGLSEVRAERNPYRPHVLCTALMQLIEESPESAELRNHWARYVAQPYAMEMRVLYEALTELLQHKGVQEARYRLRLTEAAGGGGTGNAQGGAGDARTQGGFVPGAAATRHGHDQLRAQRGASLPFMSRLHQARPDLGLALMHEFLYQPQWIEQHDERLSAAYHKEVEAQIAALLARAEPDLREHAQAQAKAQAERQALNAVDRPPRRVGVGKTLSPEHWGELASPLARVRTLMQLKAKAERVAQVLGLDAVGTLLNQVGGDERLLPPVREAFVALEPALLRMAMDDPRFLGDEAHAARGLIEAVAQRSFKFNDEFGAEFQHFMEPVRLAVRELAALPRITPADFQTRRQSLESFWRAEDSRDETTRMDALESMQFAQERQKLADHIALELSQRSDLKGAPAAVVDFLFRDWALVIAHADLASPSSKLDRGRYIAVVSDLLWSVNRAQVTKQPSRFFELAPNMIKTLRRGLEMLGKEPEETESFFAALYRYHDPLLRLQRARSSTRSAAAESKQTSSQSAPLPAVEAAWEPATEFTPPKVDEPWMGRREREATGFADPQERQEAKAALSGGSGGGASAGMKDEPEQAAASARFEAAASTPVADAAPGVSPASGAAAVTQETAPAADDELLARIRKQLASLRAGDWVDLHVDDVWRRARLRWMSDNGALFMFVSDGGRAHSMTRRTCEKLMRQRQLRPLEFDAVVERALLNLAEGAVVERDLEVA